MFWIILQLLPLDESIEADSDLVSGEISKSILTQVEGVNSSISLSDQFRLFLFWLFFQVFLFIVFRHLPVVLLDQINI